MELICELIQNKLYDDSNFGLNLGEIEKILKEYNIDNEYISEFIEYINSCFDNNTDTFEELKAIELSTTDKKDLEIDEIDFTSSELKVTFTNMNSIKKTIKSSIKQIKNKKLTSR